MNTVFVKTENCIGCRHCEIACALEHTPDKNLLSLLHGASHSRPRIKVGLGIDFMTSPIGAGIVILRHVKKSARQEQFCAKKQPDPSLSTKINAFHAVCVPWYVLSV